MQKTNIMHTKYNINYIECQLVLPLNTEILIPKDDSVRLLSQTLEGLDYTKLMQAYSHLGRKPKVKPKTLFKIIVYAYMNNIYSTRKIAAACRRDINFMWLLNGEPAPDHNTIWRFRSKRIAECVEDLFYQFIGVLDDLGEIEYSNLFIDGTKLEANANKYSFVWKKSTIKHEKKLQEKIKKSINNINKQYNETYPITESKVEVSLLETIVERLMEKKEADGINFVHGKGKRKTELQRQVETFKTYIERQKKYDDYNKLFDGRNSFSKTDTDATFMHMKDDHMRNSQLKPGYNVQIGVESQYIVGIDISSERSDQLTLIPFIEKLNENLQEKFKNIITDSGYESEENYEYLEQNNMNTFIKPQTYEGMKKSSFKKKIGKRENMKHDEIEDAYICHNGKLLKPIGIRKRTSKSGYEIEVKVYECESCEGCEYKPKCTKAKGNKRLYVSENFIEKREKSLENIISKEGIQLRMNRSIQVEGAFGVLKEDYGFRRFLTRGKKNVKTEFTLLCFGYNINKLHNKIQNNKCGISLFQVN